MSWKEYEGRDYESFWTGATKKHLDEVEWLIVSSSLRGGDTIVEIGAGFGRLGSCYVGRYPWSHMVEPANNLRQTAAETYGNHNVFYHEASVYDLLFEDETVGTALMVRVFHHLSEPEMALREIHRIVRPGGQLIFNYSKNRNIKRVAEYLSERAKNPLLLDVAAYYPTLIGYHPLYVYKLLSAAGFRIEKRYGVGISDKIVGALPWAMHLLRPSLSAPRAAGALGIAPAVFLVARRT